MQKLRSHIFKLFVITLVCSGLMASFAKSADAHRSNEDFANWLESLTKKVHNPEVERKLTSLKNSGDDLSQLIEKASRIVSQNNEDFNIPLQDTSDNIEQILLVEWNQYQTGNAMTAVPAVETFKPSVAPHFQKLLLTGGLFFEAQNGSTVVTLQSTNTVSFSYPDVFTITPLANGIAINAP